MFDGKEYHYDDNDFDYATRNRVVRIIMEAIMWKLGAEYHDAKEAAKLAEWNLFEAGLSAGMSETIVDSPYLMQVRDGDGNRMVGNYFYSGLYYDEEDADHVADENYYRELKNIHAVRVRTCMPQIAWKYVEGDEDSYVRESWDSGQDL